MALADGVSIVTTWVENPQGGRDRGPVGLVRAWFEVLLRPRRFFRTGIAPGDQAPALTFAIAVAAGYISLRVVLDPGSLPAFATRSSAATALFLAVIVLVVAPTTLHLTSAIQTLALVLAVRDRAGVSQTVQVVAYASAPCAFAALPIPAVRTLCAAYGAVLLVIGVSIVHETSIWRGVLAGAVPAVLLFGYVFGGVSAGTAIVTELARSAVLSN